MGQKRNKNYTVLISGLKEGKHLVEFDINDAFFEDIDYSEIKKGDIKATVEVTKQSALVLFDIHLAGTVHVPCDRCMDEFDLPVESDQRLVMKIDSNPDGSEERDEEIIHFPGNEKEFDISAYLYEYIVLALPIRRVHPDKENGKSGCNPEVIEKLNAVLINESKKSNAETHNDPRWDALRKLKSNFNNQRHAKPETKTIQAKKK